VTEQLRFLCVWLAIGAFVAVFWVLLVWGCVAVAS
jgi:hypothetical protein